MATADELKALGNAAIAQKEYDQAIDYFTQAIALDPSNHIFYSNRSAAYASKKEWENALQDAEQTIKLKPDWAKGWGRKGAALHGNADLEGARTAYEEGLKYEPSSAQLKSGLASVEKALSQEEGAGFGDPTGGIGNMFADPRLIEKVAANPQTSSYLADPAFMRQLQSLQHNPMGATDLFSDPRMIQVLGVLMGINLDVSTGPEGSADRAAANFNSGQDEEMPDLVRPRQAPKPQPEPVVEELDEETAAKNEAKKAAEEHKRLGTEQYKKRNFEAAIEHYSQAWELHKDITYLNNLGAAYFEKGDYPASIKACTKAVEEGREIYADFKLVAKSYARIGSAYEKQEDLPKAIEFYQKSLTEHRTPDVLNKLRAAERNNIESTRRAYISPEKAEEAREEGNKKFKESDWPGAVAAYSEMIKRAPDDPRGYGNRAAAFMKLFEFPSALDDCSQAIKKDPTFIRGYLRKAQAYFGMRKYSECVDVCTEAHVVDNEHHAGANSREIEQQQQKAFSAMYSSRENESEEESKERIMKDPDIMTIMQDPVMNAILQQAQSNPAALSEHMKNPVVRTKIQKLIAAGVVRLGR